MTRGGNDPGRLPVLSAGFLALFCGLHFISMAGDPRVTDLLKQGDLDDAHADTRGALEAFQEADKLDPNDPAVLVRISKQYSDLIADTKPQAETAKVAQMSLDYAKRAVDLDPESAKAHLALAISYGRMTDFTDTKTRLLYSKYTRDETRKSIALDPTDAYAYHVLGKWNYSIASLNPMLKLMAKFVYGGLPDASYEDAAKYLKKATDLAPQRIIHHLELARTYKAMGKADLAAREWETILILPVTNKADEDARKEATLELKTK